MSKPKREPFEAPLLDLTDDQERIILDNMYKYKGSGTALESALGALVIGRHFGWRVLRMIHSPSTYRKYEEYLGLKFEEVCPEDTKHSNRNVGFEISKKIGSFWDVVMGRKKVEEKGHIQES